MAASRKAGEVEIVLEVEPRWVPLLGILLSRWGALPFRAIRWIAENGNGGLDPRELGCDLARLIDAGLVRKVKPPYGAPVYSPSPKARRYLRP